MTAPDGTMVSRSEAPSTRLELLRSLLFSPGQRQKMINKALNLNADGVILDLEDGVPPAEKDRARETVAATLKRPQVPGSPARLVRVNQADSGRLEEDLAAVVGPGLDGVVLPKAEHPDEVRRVEAELTRLESAGGHPLGSAALIAAIESARGLHQAAEIASASRRMMAVMFGAEDFALDVGMPVRRAGAGQELLQARSALIVAATVGRVQAFDQVWLDFHDVDGLRADAVTGRGLGFTGKCLIHPSQIETVNDVFSPSEEDVELACRIVDAFEEAKTAGVGAVMLGGQLVERPIVERAQRTVRTHSAISARRRTGNGSQ